MRSADAVTVINPCFGCGYPKFGPGLCAPCRSVEVLAPWSGGVTPGNETATARPA
jgi:hypothetical protein